KRHGGNDGHQQKTHPPRRSQQDRKQGAFRHFPFHRGITIAADYQMMQKKCGPYFLDLYLASIHFLKPVLSSRNIVD
ncbi:MAG: hypothetical protein RLZZ521_1696, partial [Pseudomonadota bacterium]